MTKERRFIEAIPNRLSMNFAWPSASLLSNLFTCPFLIIFMVSMPASVRSPVWTELKHWHARHLLLIAWSSCSIILFRYLMRHSLQSEGQILSSSEEEKASEYEAWLSTLIESGSLRWSALSIFLKKPVAGQAHHAAVRQSGCRSLGEGKPTARRC